MKTILNVCLATAAAWIFPTLPLVAQEEDLSKYKLSDWTIGEVLFGEKVTKSRLRGKAVVIENWGVRCPPCIALLPHLANLDRRNRDKGLVIIGAESQNHGKEAIQPLLDKNKVEYTITKGANGPIEVRGLPRAAVFDASGQLIFHGHPGDPKFDRAVRDALRTVKANQSADEDEATTPLQLLESQAWRNSDGVEIVAAVKSADDTHVIFVLPNGRETNYPLEKLSDESRKKIEEARSAASQLAAENEE